MCEYTINCIPGSNNANILHTCLMKLIGKHVVHGTLHVLLSQLPSQQHNNYILEECNTLWGRAFTRDLHGNNNKLS